MHHGPCSLHVQTLSLQAQGRVLWRWRGAMVDPSCRSLCGAVHFPSGDGREPSSVVAVVCRLFSVVNTELGSLWPPRVVPLRSVDVSK